MKINENGCCNSISAPVICVEINLANLLGDEYLTSRETDVLRLLILGCTAKRAAQSLGISYRTVEIYVEKLKYKFGCSSKYELLEKVLANLIEPTVSGTFKGKSARL